VGVERFSVWADWDTGSTVTPELLAEVDGEWTRSDESFCSAEKRGEPTVLQLTFDVEAENANEAIAKAKPAIESLAARLRLPGALRPLTLYTMTHEYREE
jgi:hypothetical protein